MQKLVWQNSNGNEIDLTSGNYGITNWEGFSNTELNIQSQQVPFQDGAVFLDALMEQRELSVTLAMQDNGNLEERYRMRRELIHALNPKLGEGYLIYINDFISKRIKCVPQIPLFENHNSNDSGTPKASLAWTACEPYWEDVEETVLEFSYGEMPVIENEGDAPTQMKIKFDTNSVENPAIVKMNDGSTIKFEGELTKDLYIDTNIGQKQVYTENENNKLVNFAGDIYSVCYSPELKIYVACSNGVIYYSYDSIHWFFSTQNVSAFKSIVWCADLNLFVAVGNKATGTSPDGINWQSYTATESFYAVCYSHELQLFIGVCDGERILSSTDGITWTLQHYVLSDARDLYSVCYSEELHLFVAVGYERALRSSDGITWTGINNIYQLLWNVIYSDTLHLFVAVGRYGWVYRSSDGITWNTTQAGGTYDPDLMSVCFSEDLNLLVAVSSNGKVRTSSNGYSWSSVINVTSELNYIIYISESNMLLAVGNKGAIFSSYNATTWHRNYDVTVVGFGSVTFSKKHNLFVGTNGIQKSSNGENWVRKTVEGFTPNTIVYFEELGLFIGLGQASNYNGVIYSSTDASTWIKRHEFTHRLYGIAYSKELQKLVAVGSEGNIATSQNGIGWDSYTRGTDTLRSVVYAENKHLFVAVGDTGSGSSSSNGRIKTSSDGNSWTNRTPTSAPSMNAVCYAEELGLFVAVGNGKIYTSTNGTSWTAITVTGQYNDIIYCKDKSIFFAVGNSGRMLISYNGSDWISKDSGVGVNLGCIVYSETQSRFVIGGNDVTLLVYYTKENQISNINENSDLNMNLSVGDNQFRLSRDIGSFSASITYRQKYIGV